MKLVLLFLTIAMLLIFKDKSTVGDANGSHAHFSSVIFGHNTGGGREKEVRRLNHNAEEIRRISGSRQNLQFHLTNTSRDHKNALFAEIYWPLPMEMRKTGKYKLPTQMHLLITRTIPTRDDGRGSEWFGTFFLPIRRYFESPINPTVDGTSETWGLIVDVQPSFVFSSNPIMGCVTFIRDISSERSGRVVLGSRGKLPRFTNTCTRVN